MGVRRNFSRGEQSRHFAIFFSLLTMQHKWRYTKKKMFNVTATVGHSVFFVRKLYTKQIFIVVSKDILRLS